MSPSSPSPALPSPAFPSPAFPSPATASPIAAMFSGYGRRSAASRPLPSLSLFSAKGGVGVSTCAALLASHLARSGMPVLLVDLAGDLELILGVPSSDEPGVSEWLQLEHEPAPDALERLEREVAPGLAFIGRGAAGLRSDRLAHLITVLQDEDRSVIVDCGNVRPRPGVDEDAPDLQARTAVAGQMRTRWLVTRDCFVALHAAREMTLESDGVVLCQEPGRVLTRTDISTALEVPVVVSIEIDQAIFRLVDSGLLLGRPPRGLDRALDGALAAL